MAIGSIIIDNLNSQLLIYPKDNYKGEIKKVRTIKVRGEMALIKKGISLGIKNKVKVFDRFSRTTLDFKKLFK